MIINIMIYLQNTAVPKSIRFGVSDLHCNSTRPVCYAVTVSRIVITCHDDPRAVGNYTSDYTYGL
jgi:hypothetical protein